MLIERWERILEKGGKISEKFLIGRLMEDELKGMI